MIAEWGALNYRMWFLYKFRARNDALKNHVSKYIQNTHEDCFSELETYTDHIALLEERTLILKLYIPIPLVYVDENFEDPTNTSWTHAEHLNKTKCNIRVWDFFCDQLSLSYRRWKLSAMGRYWTVIMNSRDLYKHSQQNCLNRKATQLFWWWKNLIPELL